jgi:hypothetical protein
VCLSISARGACRTIGTEKNTINTKKSSLSLSDHVFRVFIVRLLCPNPEAQGATHFSGGIPLQTSNCKLQTLSDPKD